MEHKCEFRKRLMDAIAQVDASCYAKALDDKNLLLDSGVNSFTELLAIASNEAAETEIRATACWFLSRLGDDRAVSVLLKCLNDKDPHLRSEAARSLGTMGNVKTARAIIDRLKHDTSPEVRFYAIYALGLLNSKLAVTPILEKLQDITEEPKVRGMAAETLSVYSDPRTVEVLIACLSDPQAQVRYWSAFTLGELGAKQALRELKRLADIDESLLPDGSSVKREAADAIRKISSTQ